MKNTGLSCLVLVDPPAFDPHRARWMAPGCEDVFASMRIVATLDEALIGIDRVIAATARHRRHHQPVFTPAAIAADLDPDGNVAILFGREDHGLSIEQVARCESIVRIPTPEHASLNVAQAVLLVGYALFEASGKAATGRIVGGRSKRATSSLEPGGDRADVAAIEPVVQQIVEMLADIGYATPGDMVTSAARGALQRAGLSTREVAALRGMLKKLRR